VLIAAVELGMFAFRDVRWPSISRRN
jgi:hypothetical protein